MSAIGRILVVDDERRNIMLLATRLRALGYEVLEALSGMQALELAQGVYLDVVLSDVMMPGMDGLELTRRFKAHPDHGGVPVVLITALDDIEHRTRGLAAGADDFLGKPVNSVELGLRVQGQVRLRQLQQELRARAALLGGLPSPARNAGGGAVLVVDDDPRWRAILTTRLRAEGHTVTAVGSIVDGLNAIADAQPEVVIVDLRLADGSGVEFIQRLHQSCEDHRMPTILVVSCVEEATDKLAALRAGADDYLIKPVAAGELEARLQSQLRRVRTTQVLHAEVDQARLAASRDALTSLFNRGFLQDDLAGRVARATDGHHTFALAMIDVDHFKRVNDGWGHALGDEVLRRVALTLLHAVRASDVVCRYGGEEFCVVLPATHLAGAAACVERLRAAVERLACPPFLPGEVTVSAGVADWAPGDTAADILSRADMALYAAKRAGRNRVHLTGVCDE